MRTHARTHVSLLRDHLDVRTFLAYAAAVFLVAFTVQHPIEILAVLTGVWLLVTGTLEPAEYRPYLLFGAITAVGVMLFNPIVSRAGTSVIWSGPVLPVFGRLDVSVEAVVYGFVMGLRLLSVFGVFALYSALVDPDALYRVIAPFSLASALVIGLSIRLFPTTARDAERISEAMSARGVPLNSGGHTARLRARVPVISALAMTSLDRAMDLAEALESRGYGRPGRTRLPMPRLASRDMLMLAVAGVLVGMVIWCLLVPGSYSYYPVLDDASHPADLLRAAVLGIAVAAPLGLEWGWGAWLSSRSNG